MILPKNTHFISLINLSKHLTKKFHLKQSLQLYIPQHQITLIFKDSEYVLIDPNNIDIQKTFGSDKIEELAKHIQTIFKSTVNPLMITTFDPHTLNSCSEVVMPKRKM